MGGTLAMIQAGTSWVANDTNAVSIYGWRFLRLVGVKIVTRMDHTSGKTSLFERSTLCLKLGLFKNHLKREFD